LTGCRDYLTIEQVKLVLSRIDRQTLKGKRDYALFLTMTTSGMRTIEICRPDIKDLRTLGNSEVLFIQGKGRSEKDDFVKIDARVGEAVRSYLAARKESDGGNPLFSSVSNKNSSGRLTTRSLRRIIKECMASAGYNSERLSAHSLRHTALTLALLNGESLQEVQSFARHSSIATTQIYAHNIRSKTGNRQDGVNIHADNF